MEKESSRSSKVKEFNPKNKVSDMMKTIRMENEYKSLGSREGKPG